MEFITSCLALTNVNIQSDSISARISDHSYRLGFANSFFPCGTTHICRSLFISPIRQSRSSARKRDHLLFIIPSIELLFQSAELPSFSRGGSRLKCNIDVSNLYHEVDSEVKSGGCLALDYRIFRDAQIVSHDRCFSRQSTPSEKNQAYHSFCNSCYSYNWIGRHFKEANLVCKIRDERNPPLALTSFHSSPMQGVPRFDELKALFREDHMARHRHILAPDEAFGAIFTWDVVAANARELEYLCWDRVAKENGLMKPNLDDILRAELMAPEAAVSRVFRWTSDWSEIKKVVFRKQELFFDLQKDFVWDLSAGLGQFLKSLLQYGIKCCLCTKHPKSIIEPVVKSVELETVFTNNKIVSADDECDTLEHMLLIAAVKCERPPEKCVVFTDNLAGITAAHEISSKVVAMVGPHPAYEIKAADHVVCSFNDLVVYNVRRLFSAEGMKLTDPQVEP